MFTLLWIRIVICMSLSVLEGREPPAAVRPSPVTPTVRVNPNGSNHLSVVMAFAPQWHGASPLGGEGPVSWLQLRERERQADWLTRFVGSSPDTTGASASKLLSYSTGKYSLL